MDDLAVNLEALGMISFYPHFVDLGYETWRAVRNISENDLNVMRIPPDYRRKLQLLLAADASSSKSPSKSDAGARSSKRSMQEDSDAQPSSPGKVPRRKYKRHPKPDVNAPERPLTAYVRFSKDKRKEYQERRLSFSELAKQIGIDWQDLSPTLKNKYLGDAASDWTAFRKALDEYHASDQYADYVQYLRDFATENPDSNVKLPQADLSASPVQHASDPWDAEGSPNSDKEEIPMTTDIAQAPADFDMAHYHYELGQQVYYADHPTIPQTPTAHHSTMNTAPHFNNQHDMTLQGFSNPWQQPQQLHLNTIGLHSRYSRSSVPLHHAFHSTSGEHARSLQHPHQSSSDSTPGSDLSANTVISSSPGIMSSMPHALMAGQLPTDGQIYSPLMPNMYGHAFGAPFSHTQSLPQNFPYMHQSFLHPNATHHNKSPHQQAGDLDLSETHFDGNNLDLEQDWTPFLPGQDFVSAEPDSAC